MSLCLCISADYWLGRWLSSLAFTEEALNALPKGLTKLVIDVSHPVALDEDNFSSPIYIKPESMKSLTRLVNLQELRIFGMKDSFQSIIWEAAYLNKSIIRVLELQMAAPPVIFKQAYKQGWVQSKDVRKLFDIDEVAHYRSQIK